jgi:hypothetical protein
MDGSGDKMEKFNTDEPLLKLKQKRPRTSLCDYNKKYFDRKSTSQAVISIMFYFYYILIKTNLYHVLICNEKTSKETEYLVNEIPMLIFFFFIILAYILLGLQKYQVNKPASFFLN